VTTQIRIFQLAKELEMPVPKLVELCAELGYTDLSPSSVIDSERAETIRDKAGNAASAKSGRSRSVRVRALAEELKLSTKDLLNLCNRIGIGVFSPSSTITRTTADHLVRHPETKKLMSRSVSRSMLQRSQLPDSRDQPLKPVHSSPKRNRQLIPEREHLTREGVPKVSYATRELAEEAAARLEEPQGGLLKSYVCLRCGSWHIGHDSER
jgi:hypothetical protein